MTTIAWTTNIHLSPLRRWGYRKAFAANVVFSENLSPMWEEVHDRLAGEFDKDAGNHETFQCLISLSGAADPGVAYVTFSDGKVRIGTDIRAMDGNRIGTHDEPVECDPNSERLISLAPRKE